MKSCEPFLQELEEVESVCKILSHCLGCWELTVTVGKSPTPSPCAASLACSRGFVARLCVRWIKGLLRYWSACLIVELKETGCQVCD